MILKLNKSYPSFAVIAANPLQVFVIIIVVRWIYLLAEFAVATSNIAIVTRFTKESIFSLLDLRSYFLIDLFGTAEFIEAFSACDNRSFCKNFFEITFILLVQLILSHWLFFVLLLLDLLKIIVAFALASNLHITILLIRVAILLILPALSCLLIIPFWNFRLTPLKNSCFFIAFNFFGILRIHLRFFGLLS